MSNKPVCSVHARVRCGNRQWRGLRALMRPAATPPIVTSKNTTGLPRATASATAGSGARAMVPHNPTRDVFVPLLGRHGIATAAPRRPRAPVACLVQGLRAPRLQLDFCRAWPTLRGACLHLCKLATAAGLLFIFLLLIFLTVWKIGASVPCLTACPGPPRPGRRARRLPHGSQRRSVSRSKRPNRLVAMVEIFLETSNCPPSF